MNIFIEPEEIEKLADLILALRTKMDEFNVKDINIKSGEATYKWANKKHKPIPIYKNCDNCAYHSLTVYDSPCSSCDEHNNWKERTEID